MSKEKTNKTKKRTVTITKNHKEISVFLNENGISKEQALYFLQKTPEKYIYSRPAKGGGSWQYVTGGYVKQVLNFAFGFNWDFEIINQEEKYNQVITLGKLTVRDKNGHGVVKMQVGRADIKLKKGTQTPLDYGNDCKASATDALKKCASEMGVASDVYGQNEFLQIQEEIIETSEEVEIYTVAKNLITTAKDKDRLEQIAKNISNNKDDFTDEERKELLDMVAEKMNTYE